MSCYIPSWVDKDKFPSDKTYCDHGLVSAGVALTAGSEYSACAESLRSELADDNGSISAYTTIALGVHSREDVDSLQCDSEILQTVVSEAITLHNLYPAELKVRTTGDRSKGGFKTRLASHPFVFLALLVDGLQKWDRQFLLSQSPRQIKGFVPGSRYDLEIGKDRMLRIRLIDSNLDMHETERQLRSTLGVYLEDAELLIRLSLEEQ
jgi:hypothetical protein